MENNRIKVGVICIGYISQYWIAAIKKNIRYKLVAVCDVEEKTTELYGREGIEVYTDYRQLLENDNLDAVIVSLPNIFHYKVSYDALLKNKHVCCEKPLTVTLSDAQHLSEISFQQKVVLFGAFHRRYNKNFVKMIDKLKSKAIVHVEGNYLDNVEKHLASTGRRWYEKMKSAGSCIMVNGPNIYDPIVQFLGHLQITNVDIKWAQHFDIDTAASVELISDQGIPVVVNFDWMYKDERKDIVIKFQDGTECIVDMLADSQAFKSSMWHEYEGIIDDFSSRIDRCKMYYHGKIPSKDATTLNDINRDLHGEEAVNIVRLVCDSYAKENKQ